jgi:hypothetical protein
MIVAVLINNVLPAIGVFQLITVTIKITKRYPIRRWFF